MADIDQIIAGGARTNADFNFGKINDAYWAGKEQQFKADERDLFKGGVPKNADGTINYSAMRDALFQHGNIATGSALDTLDLNRQKLKYGMDAASQDFPASPQNPQPTIVSPPSANRFAPVAVAPPLNRGGTGPQASALGAGPVSTGDNSIVGAVSAAGVPDELAGPIIQQVSAMTKLDPNAPINDPAALSRIREVAGVAASRMRSGQPQQPAAQPAVAAPQAVPVAQPAPTNDPTLGGIVPPGRTPQQQLDLMTRRVASGLLTPEQSKVYETRIKAIQDHLSPTPDMKNAAASGQSLPDYQNRADENTARRDVLTKSLIPKLDASQEGASAARDEINAIHRAREQLDAPGGINAGAFADKSQLLQKVGSYFNIPNDKIANTEAFTAAIGSRVLSLVKGLGAGAGISNADRDFAAAMAGGNIKLDEKSIRRILDIGEQAARQKIVQHNDKAAKIIKANDALSGTDEVYRVEAPGAYKKAEVSAFKDGQRAFNKQTGQTIVFQNGKWVPAQ